jgi:hypothetical protein
MVKRFKDLIGKNFGRLTAIKRKRENNRTYYYCKCKCGNELWVRADCLTSGNTKSCGCLDKENRFKAKDITNKKFNKLTAIEPTNRKSKNGSVIWKCQCECKNITYVSVGDLISGKIKSCGCLTSPTSKRNIKKALKVHLKENIVENTNIPAISRKGVIASNTSGNTGVTWDKSKNKWLASIIFKKKYFFLGRYAKKEDAVKARKTAEEKLFNPFLEENKKFYIKIADEQIKVWKQVFNKKRKRFPNCFWQDINKSQLKGLLIYFFEYFLGWDINNTEFIKTDLCAEIFRKYKLSSMLWIFNNSPFEVFNFAYPNRIKRLDLNRAGKSYWTKQKYIKVLRYLLEKEKWTEEDIKANSIYVLLKKYGIQFNSLKNLKIGQYDLINAIYPGKFKPWEFNKVPPNYWNKRTGKQAVKWLIEERLQWSKEDIIKNLTVGVFRKNTLSGMLSTLFHNSPFEAISTTYPGKFKKSDFKRQGKQRR